MLRLGSLSAFHTGVVLTAVWPMTAWLWWTRPDPAVGLAAVLALVLTTLAALVRALPDKVRGAGAVAAIAGYASLAMFVRFEPLVVLTAASATLALAAGITGATHSPHDLRRQRWAFRAGDEIEAARGVAFAALLSAVVLAVFDRGDAVARVALTGAVGVPAATLAVASFRASREPDYAALAEQVGNLPVVAYLLAAALCGLTWIPGARPQAVALAPLAVLMLTVVLHSARVSAAKRQGPPRVRALDVRRRDDARGPLRAESNSVLEWISERPPRALLVSFAAAGIAGGVVLALPLAAAEAGTTADGGVSLLDAMFTAFSAVCVTGLIVVDTPGAYSFMGELVILLLIQMGGLGIMTFSTAAYSWLGGRMSVKQEATAARLASVDDRRKIGESVRTILVVTGVAELIGAVVLSLAFWSRGDDFAAAAWRGVFTSVSAFCNAGFALQTDSLIGYQRAPVVLLTCALLIIVGGLGPLVVAAVTRSIPTRIRDARRGRSSLATARLSTQAKLILTTSAALVLLPWIAIAAFEWNHALDHLPAHHRLINALFQSVTLRTAGFNSVDFGVMRPATLVIATLLMFIGGSPGSTAGGIKTTTFALLVLNVRATLRSDEVAVVDGMTLRRDSIRAASALLLLGTTAVFSLTVALLLTQSLPLQSALFESTSALATVGLSIGGTAQLDEVGKVLVLLAMFAGRVGPLTLLLALATPGSRGHPAGRYPETDIDVG